MLQSETELKVKAIRTYDMDTCLKEKPSADLAVCRQYDFASLNEFIDHGKNDGLTHIIADEKFKQTRILEGCF